MLQDRGRLVIWPVYLDASRSRSEGRIIARGAAVRTPELGEIEQAALELGLNPLVEADKAYPKSWWEVSGRVLVDKKGPKSRTARMLAERIKRRRQRV